MRNRIVGCVLAVSACLPALASAQAVILTGKTTSRIIASVVPLSKFEVSDDKGGWFEKGLEMQQLGGWNTPYEVKARLRVLSTSRDFQVRLDEPLQIRNQANLTQVFRRPGVSLGADDGASKPLAVGQSTSFQNPAPTAPGTDSVGYYNLTVSAYPPEGDFKSTVGTYSGVLSMTFEPVVRAP
ncbi:hypothetical protein G3N57_06275 [Paraburkholderia sp. Se-20369]|nr:hypothetical protein [Paraburkholderia sp. Se-20369]